MDTADIDVEELKVFLQEVEEQLQLLDEDIIRLEKEADNADLLQEIFRAAHTLKGSSGMLGFQRMAGLTHAMEDSLDKLRSGTLTVSAELVDALLQSLDALRELKENLASGDEGEFDIAPLVAALRAVAEPGGAAAPEEAEVALEAVVAADPSALQRLEAAKGEGLNAYSIRVDIDTETGWAAVRSFQVVNELTSLGEIICSVPSQEEIEQEKVGSQLRLLLATSETAEAVRASISNLDDIQAVEIGLWGESEAAAAPAPGERTAEEGPPEDSAERRVIDLGAEVRGKTEREQLEVAAQKIETMQTVRIDVDRLDALMNLVGELVIDRTRVSQIMKVLQAQYREDELVQALADTSTHIVKVVDELNEGMMQVRMLPIGTLFNKFPRLVRDLARSSGKSVDFIIEGQDTEIDRSIIEKIKDPLVHLLRNALDHGIETPETRTAAGKPLPAIVKLSAHHEQGHIMITVEDDGKGVDRQRVKESAVRKGIISAEAAERLSDAEALDLIFESGLSTAEKTTEVSGRGVGMDVVRRSVGEVNGLIKVDTNVGAGATFTLQLPLTLATFPGLLVESGNAVYAIPLSYVQETGRLDSASIETIIDTEVVNLKGSVLPLLRLSTICQTGSENGRQNGEGFMVTVKAGDRPVAVAVDALREQQEIVVKSLGAYIGQTEGIAGASILGDGQVVLILDVASLIKAAMQRNRSAAGLERRAS
jgi:two-component system chemotaxis sensor kinase CheA